MGKYLPVIKAAECGSLTRAAHALGYTQPSLGYIINNIEDELGVKLFYRDQKGVTLTETGHVLIEIMGQIEEMESRLRQTAQISQAGLFRVGVTPSVATQWIPSILAEFYRNYPDVMVKMVHQSYYLDGEVKIRDHDLDCCFFAGQCPTGMESIALHEDPYYLVVSAACDLASLQEVSVWDVVQQCQFILTNDSFDRDSPINHIYQAMKKNILLDFHPQENQAVIALVERGLGVALLPGMILMDLIGNRAVKVLRLTENLSRTVSVLCPRRAEQSYLTAPFLRITQQVVTQWKIRQKAGQGTT